MPYLIAACRRFPREGLRKHKGKRLKTTGPFPDGLEVVSCSSSVELSYSIHAQCLLRHQPHLAGHGIPLPANGVVIKWTRGAGPGPSVGLSDDEDAPEDDEEMPLKTEEVGSDDDVPLTDATRRIPANSDDERSSNTQGDRRESVRAGSAIAEKLSQVGEEGDAEDKSWFVLSTGDVMRDA
jgi:hypothetical protein